MRILLVEDDSSLADSLVALLEEHYAISAAKNLKTARKLLATYTYELIILDLTLPDGNGRELCREIRIKNHTQPILILTGNPDAENAVVLLNLGADDYLRKPFRVEELMARVSALIRRAYPTAQNSLRVADLVLNPHTHIAMRQNKELQLRPKEFAVLECLMRHAGDALTRDMILRYAWDGAEDPFPNTVDVHIKHLRDQVDRPFDTPLIHTVLGIGYTLRDVSKKAPLE